MYEKFFGLKDKPFSIAPDPRFLFMSQRHKEALAHLAYGVREGSGFVLLTGEVGTGKTTICRQILRKLPQDTRLAFVLNPMLNGIELLATICDELGIDYNQEHMSLKQLTDNLTRFLLQCQQDHENVVLMIDEAQNLAPEVLEQIRLLTNLETDNRKLLQIILVGQPELQELLARKELRQLAQRVTARYHLRPLNEDETSQYIIHRLRIAGAQKTIFSKQAIRTAFVLSNGIPRLINNLCDRAMMAAFSADSSQVTEKHLRASHQEVAPLESQPSRWQTLLPWQKASAISASVLIVLFLGYSLGQTGTPNTNTSIVQSSSPKPLEVSSTQANIPSQVGEQPPLINHDLLTGIWHRNLIQSKAESQLAQRWGFNYQKVRDGNFCQTAINYRLKCEQGFEQWSNIVQFNRPVNLRLENLQGEIAWVTLHQIKQDHSEIEFNAEKVWLPTSELLRYWSRQYQMLWQAPPGYDRAMKLGDEGISVRWLVERLQFLYPEEQIADNAPFDAYLQDLLIDFQTRKNIEADGIAGMNTLVQLNSATIAALPTLQQVTLQ